MPGITQYVLQGGPCDGNTGDLTPEIDSSRQITCKGSIYKLGNPAKVESGREVFKFAGKAPAEGSKPVAARAHSGWADMQRSVNKHMPAALSAAQRNTDAALRALGRAHRVRG